MENETEERLEHKYNECIKSLESKKEIERTDEDIENIQIYLNTLLYFRRLKLFDPVNVDNTVINISKVIKYVSIPKNNYVLKLGEKGNAFYLILKGKVSIMVAEYKKVYLNIDDYLIFLLKLYYFKENELLKETISLNNYRYAIEDDFEYFIKNIYVKQRLLENEMRNEIKAAKDNIKDAKKLNSEMFSENLTRMIEKIFPDVVDLPEIKMIKGKFNTNNKTNTYLNYIFNNNFKENEVTPDKIISLVNIDNYNVYEKGSNKAFSIPFYFQINSLERGKYFGHTALETNSKGSITIITLEDSSFGIIEKNDYFRLLSKINRELDMNFYLTLYNLPFFKDISKTSFQRFYSSFFEYHLYKRNHLLYEEKKKTNLLYLINNGCFSIYFNGNMIDLYNNLIYLQTEKNNRLNKDKYNIDDEEYKSKIKIVEKDEKDELIYNKKFKTDEFNDAVFANNEIYLGSFEGNILIGLADFVNKKTSTSLFNIKIESNYCELYEISTQNFNTIITDYPATNDIIEEFEVMKLNLIINKIITYKNNFFSSLEKKEINNISQRRSIQEREKEIAIQNKTQKSFKSSRINNKMFLSLNAERNSKINNSKFLLTEENNLFTNSYKNFRETEINNKNYSEKKRKIVIKGKILEKNKNELFLLNTDFLKNNKIRKFKSNLLTGQNSNMTLSTNKDMSLGNDSKIIKSLSNHKHNITYFTNDFFVDRIKQALYNTNLFKNPFNRKYISTMENENKLMYINMFANTNYNSSEKTLLPKSEKISNQNINKSVRTVRRKLQHIFINDKSSKNDKGIKNIYKYKYNISKVKQIIMEYNQKEKTLFDKKKLSKIKKQKDIKSGFSYYDYQTKIN